MELNGFSNCQSTINGSVSGIAKMFMVLVPVVSGYQLSFALSHFRPEKWILIAAKSIGTY